MRITLVLSIILNLLTGCFPFADGDTEYIDNTNYYVYGEPSLDRGVHLGYEDEEWGGIGLIKEPITGIGYTKEYIFAKRELNKSEYFILKRTNSGVHSEAEKNIIGPLDSLTFTNELHKLGIGDFQWKSKFRK
jgi:hypothetical protein